MVLSKLVEELYNNKKSKQIIDNLFKNKLNINKKNLLSIIFNKKFEIFKFFIQYCFEKNYINNNHKFQNNLLKIIKIKWNNGLLNIDDKQKFELIIINILNKDIIKNFKFNFNIGLIHLIFSENIESGKKFIKRIFRYLDSINFNYNNPNYKCLLSCAIGCNNIYGVKALLLRNVSVNNKYINYVIEYKIIKNLCLLKYDTINNEDNILDQINYFYEINSNYNNFSNIENDSFSNIENESIYSLNNYNGSETQTDIEIDNQQFLSFNKLLENKFNLNKLIYNFYISYIPKLDNNTIFEMYLFLLKLYYPNNIYDIDEISYILSDYFSLYFNNHDLYFKIYKIMLLLKNNGFKSNIKLFNKYKNGSKLIKYYFTSLHFKLLELFNP